MTAIDADMAWQDHAACLGASPELFFPERGGNVPEEARATCAGCPVRDECLEFALATGEKYGVWGGLSEQERKKLRRQHRLRRPA